MSENKPCVILCSDLPANRDRLSLVLKSDYQLLCIDNVDILTHTAMQYMPDLILINTNLQKLDGITACSQLSEDSTTKDIPVIFISEIFNESDILEAFKAGAVDYMKNVYYVKELRARMDNHLLLKKSRHKLKARHDELSHRMADENKRLKSLMEAAISAIVQTVESRDPYTAGHQKRVSDLGKAIGMRMGLSDSQCMGILYAGLLHDIGKLRVPEAILNRPGRLMHMEFDVLKVHPQIGSDILSNVPSPWPLARIILEHHERMDGSGYPNGFSDDDILLESRVVAVADVMEAMSAHRPYRPSKGIDIALEEINVHKGTLYDETVVDICTQLFTQENYKFGC